MIDNNWGTVWDVTWAPHLVTSMHRHARDFVAFEFTDAVFESVSPDGSATTIAIKNNEFRYFQSGLTHTEEGLTKNPPRHASIITFKDYPPTTKENKTTYPTAFKGTELVNNDRVLVRAHDWSVNSNSPLEFYNRHTFIIIKNAGELQSTNRTGKKTVLSVSPGQVIFRPAGTILKELAKNAPVHGVIVQLK